MTMIKRDKEIRLARRKGYPLSVIAQEYKLTRQRVHQICSDINPVYKFKDKVLDKRQMKE